MRMLGWYLTRTIALLGFVASSLAGEPAATIYVGGPIVTMEESTRTVEALAIADGKILAVGPRAEVEAAHKGERTRIVDLAGKTMLPGFIDAHSHYINSLSVANQVNVYAPPAGPGQDVPSIVAALEAHRDGKRIEKGALIEAYGYDDSIMPNGRTLNRDDLDAAFPEHPVIVGHVSMHGAVLNSAAMRRFGIDSKTKTPAGGVIVRKPGTDEPWGLIMETAFLPIHEQLPKPSREQEVARSRDGQRLYAAAGITTAHEGSTLASDVALMKRAAAAGAHLIDIVAFPFIVELDEVLKDNPVSTWGKYVDGFKIGGVKITIDGSPQGKTAYFSKPYLTGGPGGEQNWRGELTFPRDQVRSMVRRVHDLGVPLNLHCNGDAAIDVFLDAYEYARNGDFSKPWNVTAIHSQFMRKDQIPKFLNYGIRPSFYTLHTYYFASAHMANRGRAEALEISPMRSAIDAGLRPTNHTDFVVAPLDQMFMLWSAVNRISRAGETIGDDQRITPWEGLKAMTIWPAEQYGEQNEKGSLVAGKLADLVILDRNPLTVDPAEISKISILETIKRGKTIYERDQ
ncbi:MAG: amidohydrolase [Isosphaeraceae bacterium]|nr:amidohydrolase [Isosphaeraceae bacterium]